MQHKAIRLMIGICCIMVPVAAQAYTLTTRINTLAGQIAVNAYPVQTTAGAVMRSIVNGTNVNIVIAPASGYVISNIQQGTTYLTVTPTGQTVNIPATNTASQTINVWFGKKLVSVTAIAGVGGSVSPAGVRNLQQGTPASFLFTPATSNNVISISGTPVGATVTPAVPAAINTPVTVSFAVPATAVTMQGTFLSVIANAGTPQTVITGSTVTLDGSASTGAVNYTWTQTTGTAVTLSSSTAAKPTFTAAVAGSYQFKLVADDGAGGSSTAYTTVTATASAVAAAQSQCQDCHQGIGVGVAKNVFGDWSLSPHSSAAPPIMCYACHIGSNTGGHPGPLLSSLANICLNCHLRSPQEIAVHPVETGTNTCTACHNPHSTTPTAGGSAAQGAPHFNNITGVMYPASYMTSKADCSNCHNSNATNKTIRQQWAASGHAATTTLPWIDYDFKTRSECVRCHTTTGFIAYSTAKVTASWGVASDKTKEVLTCIGCHSNVAAGTVRAVTPNKPFADETSYTNRNVGPSNTCMDCHSGRNNGRSIQTKVGTADFTNLAYVAPHYLTAGGSLHGKSAYHFPDRTYADYSGSSHRKIGMTDNNATGTFGPCVVCHMSATNKHSFAPVSVDQSGAITAITTTVCTNCHNASMPAATLDAKRMEFNNALEILRIELKDKGFTYSADYPYFGTRQNPYLYWGTDQFGANLMGAAFNYKLFLSEPGAYTHHPLYAKQLIIDSIDAVFNNGTVTGDIGPALNDLYGKGLITNEQRDSINIYKDPESGCNSCHANTTGSHTAHLKSVFSCADCHNTTAASNTTLIPGTTAHVNGQIDLAAGPGRSFSYAAGTCSSISCHSNGTAIWGGTIACGGCHALPPPTGAHLAHTDGVGGAYGDDSNGSTVSNYRFNCGNCHPMEASRHGNGQVDLELYNPAASGFKKYNPAIAESNGSGNDTVCFNIYCHSSGQDTGVRTYTASPPWGSTFNGNRCAGCHGDPPMYPSGGTSSANANSHYSQSWENGQLVEGGHLVGLHFDNIRKDPADSLQPLFPKGGVVGSGAGHGDPATSTTISCPTCHAATVSAAGQQSAQGTAFACSSCHSNPVAGSIADKSRHINGTRDVVFMTGTFRSRAQIRLANFTSVIKPLGWTRNNGYKTYSSNDSTPFIGSYNPADKSCVTVCHLSQSARWGDTGLNCISCHADL